MTSFPYPLGPSHTDKGVNFAIYAPNAKTVALKLDMQKEAINIINKTGEIWHKLIENLQTPIKYHYLIDGEVVQDPFAPSLSTSHTWGKGAAGDSLIERLPFDWENVARPNLKKEELILYEMHIRGYTQSPTSEVEHPGKFLGMLEKVPYLLNLGINAVELLPIQEFDETQNPNIDPISKDPLCNFWGYSTLNFFTVMNRYGVTQTEIEFKTLVKELHRLGIEVILDVVYNHTSMIEEHPFHKLSSDTYYVKEGETINNDSGCGNTIKTEDPVAQELILRSLRHFAHEYQIDGFRFDLASVLKRDFGSLVKAITKDPVLKDCKLIAEPWDMAHYDVGQFFTESDRWSEWNDKYRDTVRSFIKGDKGKKGDFATRLAGSQDLYGKWGNPLSSVNFVTSHDGFTLHDLVSYNSKHNMANGENNRDGLNENISWNCGHEGPTTSRKINELREKQIMNFLLALFISKGIPMLHMGDEYGHTKMGNNNTWCQDNALSWFDWSLLDERKILVDFVKKMIRIRKEEKVLTENTFLEPEDVKWHGVKADDPQWDVEDNCLGYTLKNRLWVTFNASPQEHTVTLPEGNWEMLVHTAHTGPNLDSRTFKMEPFSSLLLRRI